GEKGSFGGGGGGGGGGVPPFTLSTPGNIQLRVVFPASPVCQCCGPTRRVGESRFRTNHMVLMAGFTAGNEKGELVVLGRNGSDYSAAGLSARLRAACCEVWPDVVRV
ncbi:hypothetical protein KCA24_35395, partial [Escherichia coli]|nr:hypothetical protein [Escherichia coli]